MFVTFEGPEGAGKSTSMQSVGARLRESGYSVICTREPGSGKLGNQIRELLLYGDQISAETELLLFLADRSNHVVETIGPALAENKIVLCDRYVDSTWVYQAYARGLDTDFVESANRFATKGLLPDLTLLLDLPPEIGLSRIRDKDRLEAEPLIFHRLVRSGFLQLAKANSDRWQVIDATLEAHTVEDLAYEAIWRHMTAKGKS